MLIVERKYGPTKFVNIFFPEASVNVNVPDYDILTYYTYKNRDEVKGVRKIQSLNTAIDLSQGIDSIWNKINRQHKRHIRRAEKTGTKVVVSNDYEKFHKIYEKFLIEKNLALPLGINILSSQFMRRYGILFLAEQNGEILGGNLYLHDENNVTPACIAYQLSGNFIDKNKMIYDANCYIHWEAMQYFKNLDIINYDLGGENHFTRSFGGDAIYQYYYIKFNSFFYQSLFASWNLSRRFML